MLTMTACGAMAKQAESDRHSEYHPRGQGWALVWSDEFNGQALDRTKWTAEESCWGGGNNEKQCYTDRPENIVVEDGVLKLKAQQEDFQGLEFPQGHAPRGDIITKTFTSGKLRTKGLASWKYGRISARMKLPKGQSTWPAFWMLPADDVYGGWPLSGEIDIMEAVNLGASCDDCGPAGQEIHTSAALHFGDKWPGNRFITQKRPLASLDAIDHFHEFALEWSAGEMSWFVDGEKYFTASQDDWHSAAAAAADNPEAPFDHPFYLMVNLAVGGNYPDGVNEKAFNAASFPSELWVDWVRVYQQR
jgi:beta-glucanase (GH16 family)